MKEASPRQREILDFIVRNIDRFLHPPTVREIGEAMGIASVNGVSDHLRQLERKGYLVDMRNISRSVIRVTEKTRKEYGLYFGTSMMKELVQVRQQKKVVNEFAILYLNGMSRIKGERLAREILDYK